MTSRFLLAEIERAEAFGVDPGSSRVWIYAPWHLRREFADGRIDREDFWLRLRRWVEVTVSEERPA